MHEKSDSDNEGDSENQAKNFSNAVATGQDSPANKELIHKTFLLRFKLLQFVNSIHTHFMTRVSLSSRKDPVFKNRFFHQVFFFLSDKLSTLL